MDCDSVIRTRVDDLLTTVFCLDRGPQALPLSPEMRLRRHKLPAVIHERQKLFIQAILFVFRVKNSGE